MNILDIDIALSDYCNKHPEASAAELHSYYRYILEKNGLDDQYNLHIIIKDLKKQLTEAFLDLDEDAEEIHSLRAILAETIKSDPIPKPKKSVEFDNEIWNSVRIEINEMINISFWTNCTMEKLNLLMPELKKYAADYKRPERRLSVLKIQETMRARAITFISHNGYSGKIYKPTKKI